MNIDIKLIKPTWGENVQDGNVSNENLKSFKYIFENSDIIVDNISFDADPESMLKLEYISLLDYEIEFKDSYNATLSLSGSEIKTLLPTIKQNLGIRYEKINKVYNSLKSRLSGGVTEYEACSCFHESLYDTPFTQNIYDDIIANGL